MHMSTAQYSSSAQQHRTCYGPKEGSCRCAPVHCCTYVQTVRSTCMQHAYTEWLSPRISKTGVDKARASAVREMPLHTAPRTQSRDCTQSPLTKHARARWIASVTTAAVIDARVSCIFNLMSSCTRCGTYSHCAISSSDTCIDAVNAIAMTCSVRSTGALTWLPVCGVTPCPP